MRQIHSILFVLPLVLTAALSENVLSKTYSVPEAAKHQQKADQGKSASLRCVEFHIGKVSCGTCIRRIERILRLSPGVLKAEVDIRKPFPAIVYYDAGKTDPKAIWSQLGTEGYLMLEPQDRPVKAVPTETVFNSGVPAMKNFDVPSTTAHPSF